MQLHLKRSKTLLAIALVWAVLGATLVVPPATATKYSFTIDATRSGAVLHLDTITSFPVSVSLNVESTSPGSTYYWQFGDGTNSTVGAAVTHVYNEPCVYDAKVTVTASNGSTTSGTLVFGAFASRGPSGALAVCPPQGTEEFIPLEVAGGFFSASQNVSVAMNGTSIGTAKADSGGDWILNVTGILPPEPNGTTYIFTTTPNSQTDAFTTVEGIKAWPSSGVPGESVVVEGGSYPSDSSVMLYLGNVSLGTEQTFGNGSFLASVIIPSVPPLTTAGTYDYTTTPPILGTHASFTSAGVTGLSVISSTLWWWVLLIALILVAVYLFWRMEKRRAVSQESGTPPPRIRRLFSP